MSFTKSFLNILSNAKSIDGDLSNDSPGVSFLGQTVISRILSGTMGRDPEDDIGEIYVHGIPVPIDISCSEGDSSYYVRSQKIDKNCFQGSLRLDINDYDENIKGHLTINSSFSDIALGYGLASMKLNLNSLLDRVGLNHNLLQLSNQIDDIHHDNIDNLLPVKPTDVNKYFEGMMEIKGIINDNRDLSKDDLIDILDSEKYRDSNAVFTLREISLYENTPPSLILGDMINHSSDWKSFKYPSFTDVINRSNEKHKTYQENATSSIYHMLSSDHGVSVDSIKRTLTQNIMIHELAHAYDFETSITESLNTEETFIGRFLHNLGKKDDNFDIKKEAFADFSAIPIAAAVMASNEGISIDKAMAVVINYNAIMRSSTHLNDEHIGCAYAVDYLIKNPDIYESMTKLAFERYSKEGFGFQKDMIPLFINSSELMSQQSFTSNLPTKGHEQNNNAVRDSLLMAVSELNDYTINNIHIPDSGGLKDKEGHLQIEFNI